MGESLHGARPIKQYDYLYSSFIGNASGHYTWQWTFQKFNGEGFLHHAETGPKLKSSRVVRGSGHAVERGRYMMKQGTPSPNMRA
jgi:hypothetical protein